MKILVTGGCGFVGSSVALYLQKKYPSYKLLAFDNLRRRGSELNINRLKETGIEFVHGDIRHKEDLECVGRVDVIIEASAEPSVLAGIDSTPDYTINTNLLGTIHALNFARQCNASFIFLSTSRVYPINQIEKIKTVETESRFNLAEVQEIPGVSAQGISEKFPMEGYRSIYGATKLASEIMIGEYHHYYGIKTVINRCGVLTGPWQMGKADQGVAVLWVARHYWKQPLSYIGFGGQGKQVRDVLDVKDLCRLIDFQIHNLSMFNGELLNIGGGLSGSLSLREMTDLCREITGNSISIKSVSDNRQADIALYVTDNAKVERLCGWRPEITTRETFGEIFNWIKENEATLTSILK